MPVWPFLIATSAGLALWGVRIGEGAWRPGLVLVAAYVAVRAVIWGMDPSTHEVAMPILWALAALLLSLCGWHVAGLFFLASGLTYPVLLVFGFRIEWMGISPIIAEVFAGLGFVVLGGGLAAMAGLFNPDPHSSGFVSGIHRLAVYLAPSAKIDCKNLGADRG